MQFSLAALIPIKISSQNTYYFITLSNISRLFPTYALISCAI